MPFPIVITYDVWYRENQEGMKKIIVEEIKRS